MGSVGNTNPWAPYDSYKDCSQGICSVYCPQWCYFLLPPPPPDDESSSDDSTTAFSPLIIAIIGILASAFLLVSYYTIITKYCKRRRNRNAAAANEMESNRDETPQDQWQVATVGLDESVIKAITVCKYKKGEGLVEDNECSVCLSEFQDDEKLRLLPKCNHAFHLPCIDTWLKCHSNCPLCRANVISPPQQQQQQQQQNSSTNLNINAIQYQRTNDLILVVDAHDERIHREEEAVVVSIVCNDTGERCECSDNRIGNEQFRRSFSLGEFSRRRYLLADTMKMAEDHEVCNSPASDMKRSVSTGRFMNKGKDSVLLC